jgi:hypothetical protein
MIVLFPNADDTLSWKVIEEARAVSRQQNNWIAMYARGCMEHAAVLKIVVHSAQGSHVHLYTRIPRHCLSIAGGRAQHVNAQSSCSEKVTAAEQKAVRAGE